MKADTNPIKIEPIKHIAKITEYYNYGRSTCKICGGSGEIKGQKCLSCNGYGWKNNI